VYELIWDDDEVNAWVICWSENQDTGFHDHDQSVAAIAVISGQVREERMRLGSSPHVRVARAGSTFTVPPVAIHRVLHAGEHPAVTIHAYSPPLVRTGTYRMGPTREFERVSLPDRRGAARNPRIQLTGTESISYISLASSRRGAVRAQDDQTGDRVVRNHRRDRSPRREPSERDTSTIAMSLGSHGGRSGNDPQHAETSMNSHLFQATIESPDQRSTA